MPKIVDNVSGTVVRVEPRRVSSEVIGVGHEDDISVMVFERLRVVFAKSGELTLLALIR